MENIKDFVLEDLGAAVEKTAAAKPARKKTTTEYEIAFVSGPDFAVRRKTPKTSSVVVCLASKNQLYVKNEKTGEIRRAGAEDLRKHFMDLPEEGLPLVGEDGSRSWWGARFERGAEFADSFSEAFYDDALRSLIVSGLFRFPDSNGRGTSAVDTAIGVAGRVDASQTRKLKKLVSIGGEKLGRDAAIEIVSSALLGAAPCDVRVDGGAELNAVARKLSVAARELRCAFCGGFITPLVALKEGAPRGARDAWRWEAEDVTACAIGDAFEIVEQQWGESGVDRFVRAFFDSDVEDLPSPSAFGASFFAGYVGYGDVDEEVVRKAALAVGISPEQAARRDRYRGCSGAYAYDETVRYDLDRFLEYVFRESYAQGYHLTDFFVEWTDATKMQRDVYGRVVDKYPQQLASFHKKLSYKHEILTKEIDAKKFAEAAEKMKARRWASGEWVMTSPETKADMLDEAQAQSNCLSSYVDMVADGTREIFFLRKAKAPDKSYVTVEVRDDGSLGQVKARYNATPDPKAVGFVREWHRKFYPEKYVSVA